MVHNNSLMFVLQVAHRIGQKSLGAQSYQAYSLTTVAKVVQASVPVEIRQ